MALALILGILLAEYRSWQAGLSAVMLVTVVLLPQCMKHNYRECALRGALLVAAGALGTGCYVRQADSWEKEAQVLLCGQQLHVCGTLIRKEQKNERWQLTLALSGYENRVVVSSEDGGYPLESVLSVKGLVREFNSPRNEGQFNEKQYYKNRKVIGRMSADEIRCIRAPVGVYAWRETLYCMRMRLCTVYEACLPAKEAGILSTMAAGEKAFLDGDVRTLFQRAGISHMLAISGMHISMIGMGLYRLLRRGRRSYGCCALLTAGVLLLYGTMIGMGVSASRAIGMFLIFLLAQCLGQGYDTCAALSVLAVILLVDNPFLLHDVSFQFSFLAVFAAVTAGMVLPKKEEGGRVYGFIYPFCTALLLQLFTLPLVAYYYYEVPLYAIFLNLLLLPYLGAALGFGLIGGCVGMFLLSYAGFLGYAGTFFLPFTRFLLSPCRIVLSVYVYVCEMVEKWPFSSVICGQPTAGKLCVYYGLLAGMLLVLEHRKKRGGTLGWGEKKPSGAKEKNDHPVIVQKRAKKARCMADEYRKDSGKYVEGTGIMQGIGERKESGDVEEKHGMKGIYSFMPVGTFVLLAIILHAPAGGFEIDYLDVGQGDGSMLRTKEGVVCFVDGGSTDVSKVGTYRILPFLKSKGIRRVDYWILSHLDEDHVNGFYEVLESGYPVGAVVVSERMPEDEAKAHLSEMLAQYQVPVITVDGGDTLQLQKTSGSEVMFDENDDGAAMHHLSAPVLRILSPDETTPVDDVNGASLVFLYEDAQVRALWTGDIGEQQEECLLAGGRLSQIDLYKAAHHGSKYSNSAEYLQALSPKLSVISCGKRNRYGHPGVEAIEHMEAAGSRIFYTMASGQIKVRQGEEGLMVEEACYWNAEGVS